LDWISARSWLSVVTGVGLLPLLPAGGGGGGVPLLPAAGGVVPLLPAGGGVVPPPDPPPPQPAISNIATIRLATCIDLVMSVSLFDP
jgi:hypothetical protein